MRRFFGSVFRGLADMQEFAVIPILAVIGLLAVLSMPFVEKVEPGEIVVCESRFGGGTEVWRGWMVEGWHWQGLGKVTEYHADAGRKFATEIDVDGTRYVVRGTARFRVWGDDDKILAIHRTYGSEDVIADKLVLPAVDAALREAAASPSWTRRDGNLVERKLKDGFEYALKRVSPTGSVWTAPETRVKLQQEMNARLSGVTGPHDIPMTVELGFVTER